MDKERCNVLIPGGFKPVHAGHILMIDKYLNNPEYDTHVAIVFGKSKRDGISADSTKWFLDQIYKDNDKVDVVLSDKATPLLDVYNMTGKRKYGKGIYVMGVSTKENDNRAVTYADSFKQGKKYYTPGVETMIMNLDINPLKYAGRGDVYEDKPISSTVVRSDVRDDNYKLFRTSYFPLLSKSIIDEDTLKKYYEKLRNEIVIPDKTHLNDNLYESFIAEGGLAGHMNHPYEVDEFTFGDLKSMIKDLFIGKITDVTEKLDGVNLFASVDERGNTIFARNISHINNEPWTLKDIMNNPKWDNKPSVQHAFSNGAATVDKVFKNIPNAINVFNYDDKADGLRYRHWVNLEIIDTDNANVIPYVESTVSFHSFSSVCFDYSNKNKALHKTELIPTAKSEEVRLMDILRKAIKKTDKSSEFNAQVTPELVFKHVMNSSEKAQKYIDRITAIQEKYDSMTDQNTLLDYKMSALYNALENSKLDFLSGDILDLLIDRWVKGDKKVRINDLLNNYRLAGNELLTKEQKEKIKNFDSSQIAVVMKSIMKPFDKIFIDLGNEIIKHFDGLANSGHESKVIKSLKKEIKNLKAALENNTDPRLQAKLQAAINRLSAANYELNSTEGLVFNYRGHVIKLTGSFAPLNALLGLRPGKFDKK